ncbi:MAG: hypothetical protein K2H36_02115, partial [Clostridia bacterium]|nr:hypothetical protein [Clostridia bacterium]
MQILELIAFTFHWERLTQPAVIAGVCIMIVGLVLNFCSTPIARSIANKRKAKGEVENFEMLQASFKFISVAIVLIGIL